jgi:NAD(P)-dependent dehydrogenase (short-subunit alcohol dehydrogenase family)
MADRLIGKVALVFGAGSSGCGWGNGKAAAVAYAREGARVACLDLSREAADATATLIREEGNEAEAFAVDVTDYASVAAAVDGVLARYRQADVLHNNVGVAVMGGPEELDEEAWRRAIDLNLGSLYRTCKAVLPHMRARRCGAIVNISSIAAIRYTGYPYFAYYAAKAAVNQATVALALQHAKDGIRANAVMPGLIDTPLIYRQIADQYASAEAMVAARNRLVPLGRMGEAWDVANAAVFLASDEAKFITGVCLPVDGGQSAGMGPATA